MVAQNVWILILMDRSCKEESLDLVSIFEIWDEDCPKRNVVLLGFPLKTSLIVTFAGDKISL